jgi:cardiolipin synthase
MNIQKMKGTIDAWVIRNAVGKIPLWVTANDITRSRLSLVPLLPLAYIFAGPWLAAVIFAIASLTDYFDGLVARVRGKTKWGKKWDERADKILVGVTVAFLIAMTTFENGISVWVIVLTFLLFLVLVRDKMVTWARDNGYAFEHVLWSAKIKTAVQMVACISLLLGVYHEFFLHFGVFLFLLSTGLSIYTGWVYLEPLRKKYFG